MRSSLLSSVSHDLRTPLGVITGATSTLLQDPHFLDEEAKRDLLESAHEEAERENRSAVVAWHTMSYHPFPRASFHLTGTRRATRT